MSEKYRGMNNSGTGTLTDADHVWQSANDILLTPIGSRIMRRNYGSLVPDLLDSPQNDVTRLQLMSATVIALAAWEPRLALDTINISYSPTGAVTAEMAGMLTVSMEKSTGTIELRSHNDAND
ncbi:MULTISPECIES: GPW/gp25 family protein [Serratia]|uniref:GPW/gp25 family protein n=1 Tax=Serratia marcescens TaxID=615 RepID=A0ABD5BLL2_SERMA|nr:GPW/gp25 family protein [Serratia marcescens]MCZ6927710.1 baseplate assembly protein [Serratia marcescens]MDE5235677.1 GPW/gp25 family protein [Serratia marcescens]MDE5256294.1 GPW/gp25 family protein [Serratia marcescens]MDQ9377640.1 GPW/gp25 family protein [Serratia marcescens]MDQ9379198.1 GPW/gp25 family protein [Serratia marcescens]